jgi:hypothetical protein
LAINSVENVNVTVLKQNSSSTSAAKKAAKQFQNLHHKANSKIRNASKVDTIEISEEGKALAGLLPNKNTSDVK